MVLARVGWPWGDLRSWAYFFLRQRNPKSLLACMRFLYSYSFFLVFLFFQENRAIDRMNA